MRSKARPCILLAALLVLALSGESRAGWKAGIARRDVTPRDAVWLSGYAARTRPSEGVAGPIQVKALALEDGSGARLLVLTSDLLTMPQSLAEPVAARLAARYGLPRARILLSASHSHSAPAIRDRLLDMYPLDEAGREQVDRYTEAVAEALFAAGSEALGGMTEAEIHAGSATAGFAANRRALSPQDPVDHQVPVLRVDLTGPERGPAPPRRAVLFAYACHNTTLAGYRVSGDYAGFAQAALEAASPGLLALFASGCGGDQNPHPRGNLELASRHGLELAAAVAGVLASPMRKLDPETAAAFGWTDLELSEPPEREAIEKELREGNVYQQRRARRLLAMLEEGGIPRKYSYPAQVWRLGREWWIALAGEVVVDYALRLKREIPPLVGAGGKDPIGVAVLAYANDVPGYVPSERVLREGGYEGGGAMLYYGFHGPWAAGVEEAVVSHVRALALDAARRREGVREAEARLERVWGDGAFTEGPAWGPEGALYFSDIPNDRILRWREGRVEEHRRPSGKANGLAFDGEGRLIACEGADGGHRRVTRSAKDGGVEVLADRFRGGRFNSPNDLAVARDGTVYFSDPRYAGSEPRELDEESVYRVRPAGEVERAISGLVRPNGLALSPDGTALYVSDAGARKLLAYRVEEGGGVRYERAVFDFGENRGIDGMEVDEAGNIYGAAGRGELAGIYVISPRGALLDLIPVPETPTNCCFGEDGRTLFVTAGRSLYRIRVRPRGTAPSGWFR